MADANPISTPEGREGSFAPRIFVRHGEVFANSRDVAEDFGKEHRDVLRAIDNLIEQEPSLAGEHLRNFAQVFVDSEGHNGATRKFRIFNMNRDGFSLLAMGFTGPRALKWKLRYIEAFNMMERELAARASVSSLPALVESPEIGESIREQRMALDMVREARILFGHGAARRMWREMPILPAAVSTDPALEEAREALTETGPAADWRGALTHLLQWAMPLPEAAGDNMERWIRAAAEVNGEWIRGRTAPEIRRALRVCGLDVEAHSSPSLTIANNHPWLSACFLETAWAYGVWRRALLCAPGAEKVGPTRFGGHGRHTSRAVRIPLSVVLTFEE